MSNNIEDKKGNYEVVRNILSSRYQEVNGYDFYRYIFPDNQNVGELSGDYSRPNAIYLEWQQKFRQFFKVCFSKNL